MRVILDCDPGHDDALALLMAAHHLDLVGVTTVFGNSTVENTTANALAILDAAGLEHIPVAAGASQPLEGRIHSGESVHGKTGLDGANLPPSRRRTVDADAADFIYEQACAGDDLIVIAVAPETNVATALTRYPDLATKLRAISVMGGSTEGGNATAAAEFNILADPEAAAIVFGAGVPVTMVGLNVTTSFGLKQHHLDSLSKSSSGIARELAGALSFYLSRQAAMYERTRAPVHDVCAVLPFSHPGLIRHTDIHVGIECQGALTRGMTVCDLRGAIAKEGIEPAQPANASVAVSADGDAIIRLLLDTLNRFP